MDKTLRDLIGRKIEISVDEPWGFKSDAGGIILEGSITMVSPENEDRKWIMCEVSPFHDENFKITRVVVAKRYRGHNLISLLDEKEVIVHIHYEPKRQDLLPPELIKRLEKRRSSHFLIGSIRLVNN